MFEDKDDEIFLARWINNELSTEELEKFKQHPDFEQYEKIKIASDNLDVREYDIDTALGAVKNKTAKTSRKSVPIIKLYPYVAVAASLAIIFTLIFYNPNESFETAVGEKVVVTLPDGSEMILNADSKASFNEKNWDTERTVSLEGEAFFKVQKGSKFSVNTSNGDVWVLGTEFTVQSFNTFFEVSCFEGKVRVVDSDNQRILTPGMMYRNIDNKVEDITFEEAEPSWKNNSTTLKSVPFKYVIKKLEQHYAIEVKANTVDLNTIYTGTFPNDNKEVALKTVFSTLGIAYSISEDGKTVVLEQ